VDLVAAWNLELNIPRQASGSGARVVASSEDSAPSTSSHRAADSDETLMQRYQRGSELAFHELYGRYRAPLLRYIRRLCHGPEEYEEIAQETWMAVIQGRERYAPQARFVTYLFAIAHNRETAKSRLRFALARLRSLLEPWA
jgi:RNA polymerase sigma-70 factor (ECF subfamily)